MASLTRVEKDDGAKTMICGKGKLAGFKIRFENNSILFYFFFVIL